MRKVVNTRNYEIHLDPENEANAITGVEVALLVFQLRALVEMTLLLELGFSCEDVHGIFERLNRYTLIEKVRSQV